MQIIRIEDREDGGCDMEVQLTELEKEALIGYAVKDILVKAAKKALEE